MKKLIIASTAVVLASFANYGMAATETQPQQGCALKISNIQSQIDYAKTHGNTHRIDGLQKALSEAQEHCTDAKLKAELNTKIAEKTQKVTERQAELKEVTEKGDQDKIAKKTKKLAEANHELAEAKQELTTYFP